MFRQFRNPISVLSVVFLCIILAFIPSEGAVNNAVIAQSPANNGDTRQAPVINNSVTSKTPANNGMATKAPVGNGITTKPSTNNGATIKAALSNKASTKAPANSGGTPFDLQSTLAQLLPSSIGDAVKQATQALDLLKYAFIGSPPQYTPSSECLGDVTDFLQSVLSGQMWALKMVDAIGKPVSGILGGSLTWPGSFDECIDVRAAINKSGEIIYPWKGQYCLAHFELKNVGKQLGLNYEAMGKNAPSLNIGVCLPNSCADKDVTILIYKCKKNM